MEEHDINLRSILDPITPDAFFADNFDRKPIHIPGPADKFAHVFSWPELNAQLASVHLWSEKTMRVVLDMVDVPHEEYSVPGKNRFLDPVLLPDLKIVQSLLMRGATLVLDRTERLTPAMAKVADSIELATGGRANCNTYCSWQAHPGFKSHYDTMDVFVLQIDGHKKWNIYETRVDGPTEYPPFDFASQSDAHHDAVKGPVVMTPEMSPGDFLYIPAGQYHDAIASSEASLHLTFGTVRATGIDLVRMITGIDSIASIADFRRPLPHFDDVEAHDHHIRQLADKLHTLLSDPRNTAQFRDLQRRQAFGHLSPGFELPVRNEHALFRVLDRTAKTVRRGPNWILRSAGGETTLQPAEADIAGWIIGRDGFSTLDLQNAFADTEIDLVAVLQTLAAAALIEAV